MEGMVALHAGPERRAHTDFIVTNRAVDLLLLESFDERLAESRSTLFRDVEERKFFFDVGTVAVSFCLFVFRVVVLSFLLSASLSLEFLTSALLFLFSVTGRLSGCGFLMSQWRSICTTEVVLSFRLPVFW